MKTLAGGLALVGILFAVLPARAELDVSRVWQADNFAWVVVTYRNHTAANLSSVVIECIARDADERPFSSARKVRQAVLGPGGSFEERLLIGLDGNSLDTTLCSAEGRRAP